LDVTIDGVWIGNWIHWDIYTDNDTRVLLDNIKYVRYAITVVSAQNRIDSRWYGLSQCQFIKRRLDDLVVSQYIPMQRDGEIVTSAILVL
jgi:hypothetical protein